MQSGEKDIARQEERWESISRLTKVLVLVLTMALVPAEWSAARWTQIATEISTYGTHFPREGWVHDVFFASAGLCVLIGSIIIIRLTMRGLIRSRAHDLPPFWRRPITLHRNEAPVSTPT
jgi:hypothetical protein